MIKIIRSEALKGSQKIKILYPGFSFLEGDSGIGSIGRVDFAEIDGDHLIPMHPHINDEILSYFRVGSCEHADSEGLKKTLNRQTLMLMKAGSLFYHKEKVVNFLEGLQIFIRPGKENLKPSVTFLELDPVESVNAWRQLASPDEDASLQFSSQTWVYDIFLTNQKIVQLPHHPGLTFLLIVFKGTVLINNYILLDAQSSMIILHENVNISTESEAELVLLVSDPKAEVFKKGMFSGNII